MSAEWFSITPRCRPVIRAFERLIDEIIESVVGLQKRLDPLPQTRYRGRIRGRELHRGPWGHDGLQPQKNSLHALRVQRHGVLLPQCTISPIHTLTRRLWPVLSKKIKKRKSVNVLDRKGRRIESAVADRIVDQYGVIETRLAGRFGRRGRPAVLASARADALRPRA